MSDKNWGVFDIEDGIQFFETETEATDRAKEYLQDYADNASDDGWFEGTDRIAVLQVIKRVVQTNLRRPSSELDEEGEDSNGDYWGHGFETMCDYELRPISAREGAESE